ncbi:cyclic nucleotide-binding domain protein [Verrucomicrobiia bacterium DG1235]|nr:cyclic nucleotide-binding domain protein [Verrucomicrobiae bacterium DG1235]
MRLPEFLAQHASPAALAKGQHLFRQGEPEQRLAYVVHGTLKAYYLQENGSERIKSFITETDIIGSLQSAARDTPSPFSLIALEDCQLLRFEFQTLQDAADLQLSTDVVQTLISLAVKKERREYEFLCLKPEQRYLSLQRRAPKWFGRVTQNDIALYLGITPVALSRIRRRITTKT